MRTIYLISGPLGVGKTSLCKIIAKSSDNCVYLDGDAMFVPLETIKDLSWEKRLKLTWGNIVDIARRYIQSDMDVAIDFVVEDELEWFCDNIKDLDIELKYVVLVADELTLKVRLKKRGELQYLSRSQKLLKKLRNDLGNKLHLIDITNKNTNEVLQAINSEERFIIELV